jgi:glycine betaine/choline ABC-type transport system substrate-binding protein
VLLRDDKHLQPVDNPIALVRKDKDSRDLNAVLRSVNAKLDAKSVDQMTLRVFNEQLDPATVVADWLKAERLT